MTRRRSYELAAAGAGAALVFTGVAVATATRKSAHVDRTLAPRLALRPRSRGRRAAESLSPLGKWYVIVAASAIGGALVARAPRRRRAGAIVAAAPIAATLLSKILDEALPQPPVPANHRHEPRKAVFPSGHGLVPTSASLTAAYVLSREGLVDPRAAWPTAIAFSLAHPALKLAVRKHWLTDAVGGVLAGAAVAAICCAAYEADR